MFGALRRAAARKSVAITFTDSNQTATDGDYTFTGASIGAADPFRRVIVGVSGSALSRTCTVTVGGAATTQLVFGNAAGSGFTQCGLYITDAFYTSGTTANIAVNWSSTGQNRTQVGVWRMIRKGAATAESTDFQSGDDAAANNSITVSNASSIVAVTHFWNTGTGVPTGWGGVSSDYGALVEGNAYGGGAHSNNNTAGAKTISVTMPGTITGPGVLVSAGFAPQ